MSIVLRIYYVCYDTIKIFSCQVIIAVSIISFIIYRSLIHYISGIGGARSYLTFFAK